MAQINLLFTKKQVKKFLKLIPHNRQHKRALKLNGYCYALIDNQRYFIEVRR